MSALDHLPSPRGPLGDHNASRYRISQATTSSYVTATSNGSSDIPSHGIRHSIEARPNSRNEVHESVSSRHYHSEEPPTLPRIAASPADSLIEIVPHVEGPLQNEASYPVSHEHRKRSPGKGFCVLCLDGGGCRGYVSLLLLKRLLRQLQPDGPIYPYLYFDLICGTSTGGLIAILLASFHVDIDTALKIYRSLVRKVFSNGFSLIRYWFTDAGYCRKPLQRAIAKILKKHGGGRILMHDPKYDRDCRCFVTTTHCVGEEGRTVLALRSYAPPGGTATIPDGHDWTCDEAAIATTAAPGFFKRHMIANDEHRFFFEDAGAHCVNNPTRFALEECRKLDEADSLLNAANNALFVSLGTGTWSDIHTASCFLGLFKNKIATLKASLRYATSVKQVDGSMKKEAQEHKMSYFRINPALGGKIRLGDSAEIPAMEASVMDFFKEEERMREFKECAAQLRLFQTVDRRIPQNRTSPASL